MIASAIGSTPCADDPLPCNRKITETGVEDVRIGEDEKTWTLRPAISISSFEIDWDIFKF